MTDTPATTPPGPGLSAPGSTAPDFPVREWTAAQIRGLGLHTDVGTAASILGISRSTAYELIDRGEFPLPVLRLGTRYRIAVAAILTALGLPAEPSPPPPGAVERSEPAGTDALHAAQPSAAGASPGLDERPTTSVDQTP